MPTSPLAVVFCSGLLWLAYRIARRFIGSGPLSNIPGPPPISTIFGSLSMMQHRKAWDYHYNIAESYPGIAKVKGFLGADCLFISDPLALHHILVKDQNIYEETDAFIESNRMTFGEGILTSIGEPHRRQRKLLNPVFSIAHMRNMLIIFYEVSHRVRKTLLQKAKDGPKEVDVMEWMTRTASELIGQSGLGFSFDTLEDGSVPHRYGMASKQLIPLSTKSSMLGNLLIPYLTRIGTRRFRRFIVDIFPSDIVRQTRDIIDVLHETSVEIFESKKKALLEGDEAVAAQIGQGKDIISILMKANSEAAEEDRMSEEESLGQITSLTFAATDTTSTALARTLHLLSQHKDAQDLLRQEIRQARLENDGEDLSYDTLVSLPYLDAICRETLRMYAPISTLVRIARGDITLPLSTSIKGLDGKEISEVAVPKNTKTYISILASNRNKHIWGEDAYEWKPERWLNPLPQSLVEARIPGVYSHLLTFIGGGRSCIGFKFSQLEMKVVLALLIDCLEFSPGDKDIIWQMTAIATPNTDADSTAPTMPLIISKAK